MTEEYGRGPDHEAVSVLIHQLDEELPLPSYAHPGDAGLDLYARSQHTIAPGERVLVNTGVAIALPAGYVALVHPRSGLALKHGLTVLNAPGTIDGGYRGEIGVVLHNSDATEPYTIHRGERIAQLVIQRYEPVDLILVDRLPGSSRGTGGYGSTGTGVKGRHQ